MCDFSNWDSKHAVFINRFCVLDPGVWEPRCLTVWSDKRSSSQGRGNSQTGRLEGGALWNGCTIAMSSSPRSCHPWIFCGWVVSYPCSYSHCMLQFIPFGNHATQTKEFRQFSQYKCALKLWIFCFPDTHLLSEVMNHPQSCAHFPSLLHVQWGTCKSTATYPGEKSMRSISEVHLRFLSRIRWTSEMNRQTWLLWDEPPTNYLLGSASPFS